MRSQGTLRKDTHAEQSSLSPVFSARLERITNQMTQVAAYFTPTASVSEMQSSEQVQLQILDGLTEMIASVETELPLSGQSAKSGSISSAARQAKNATNPGSDTRSQLRLLKSWQQTVSEQTARLASRQRRRGKLSDLENRQLKELAVTQQQLGTLALMLSKHSVTTPETPGSPSSHFDNAPSHPE